MAVIVYSPHVNLGLPGLQRLHPFDGGKYGRAWNLLRRRLHRLRLTIDRPAYALEQRLAHTNDYLARCEQPTAVAAALEIPGLRRCPGWFLRWLITGPMRWAVRGTMLAARVALDQGVAVHLGGGFHHAKPARGEGFCLYSDIAIAVRQLRGEGRIGRVAYIDLDAHQGNGVCHHFADNRQMFVYDQYNADVYPFGDRTARHRIDCDVPLTMGVRGDEYLRRLSQRLPGFLDSVGRTESLTLGIVNAGSDVIAGDPLGGMALTSNDVAERDRFTVSELRRRHIPTVVLASGGYTRDSYKLLAATAEACVGV